MEVAVSGVSDAIAGGAGNVLAKTDIAKKIANKLKKVLTRNDMVIGDRIINKLTGAVTYVKDVVGETKDIVKKATAKTVEQTKKATKIVKTKVVENGKSLVKQSSDLLKLNFKMATAGGPNVNYNQAKQICSVGIPEIELNPLQKQFREATGMNNTSGSVSKNAGAGNLDPRFDPNKIADFYEGRVDNRVLLKHGDSKQASTILSDELKNVGIGRPKYPTEAHHIVPINQAKNAAAKLESLGININSSANGVLLPAKRIKGNPQTLHSYKSSGMMRHGKDYIELIDEGMKSVNTYDEAMDFLNSVRRGLLDGSIDVYK